MYLCRDTDDYDATKYITDGWSKSLTSTFQSSTYVDAPTGTGSDTGQIIWDTSGFAQSHTNPTDMELFAPSELGLEGRKYIYANDTNSGMKGVINVTPMAHTDTVASTSDFPFWDYTVPASGGRSALKLRVYRYINSSTSYVGYISNVQILTKGTGWLLQCVLTPGDRWMGRSTERITKEIDKEVRRLFPSAKNLKLLWSNVVQIPQSLYREAPGMEPFRPNQKTSISNFFMAGSYTKQDYIDSMEGATMSGHLAAAAILEKKVELAKNLAVS